MVFPATSSRPSIEAVRSIRVAGAPHCVEDDDGVLRADIVATEQCDNCGSTRDDGSQAPFVLCNKSPGGGPAYECSQCGLVYSINFTAEKYTVF